MARQPEPSHLHAAGDRRLVYAIIVNLVLTAAQVAGGVISGSLALLADAAHNLSDAGALIIALIARRIARVPADADHTYGHGRAELIGAFVNLVWLVLIALLLLFEATSRLINPHPIEGWIVFALAGLGLAVNTTTALLTWRMARGSLNIRAAFINNMSDALASLAVMIGGVLIILYDLAYIDALVTYAIAGYLLVVAGTSLPRVIHILMQRVPDDLDVDAVAARLGHVEGVIELHDMHIWEIDEHTRSLEAHVVIKRVDAQQMEQIKEALKARLLTDFRIEHSTLEFEFAD